MSDRTVWALIFLGLAAEFVVLAFFTPYGIFAR